MKVKTAKIKERLPELHRALLDVVGIINGPERDDAMLKLADLTLERALFPLLVLVEKYGPVGVVDLAGRVGRDYTTVSRQLTRLKELGLIERRSHETDKRMREAIITPKGKLATDAVDHARELMMVSTFRSWSEKEFDTFTELLRRFADQLK